MSVAADYFGDDFPDYYDVAAGRWLVNGFWTEGFWPGLLWLLHRHSGEARLRDHAARATRRLIQVKADMDDHDLGFLYFPSCVLGNEIVSDEEMASAAVAAAYRLSRRFLKPSRYIPAHGPLDGPRAGFAIIDTVMNLRLLFWASRRTGDRSLADMARETAATIAERHVRANGSSCQVLWLDPATGEILRAEAVMAVSVESCWARGQAWGVQGFAQVFEDSGVRQFRSVAERMAEYFLARIPADGVVFHDLDDPSAPNVPRDTSAQAIAAGGMVTLAETSGGDERGRWLERAEQLLAPLVSRYLVAVDEAALPPRGLLSHGCKSLRKNQGLVSDIVFGDYYFVDALTRWRRLASEPDRVALP